MTDIRSDRLLKYLFYKPIILMAVFLLLSHALFAQRELNRENHDQLPFYFGLTFGYANMNLYTTKHPVFLKYDSVLSVEPGASGGIALGLLATRRINKRLEVRTAPQLIVGGSKFFTYSLQYPNAVEGPIVKKTLPSTIFSLPVQFKFNSDRIDNFRVYMMGGLRAGIDLSSNSNARNAEDLVKLKKSEYGYEAGVGFSIYMKYVTISPELKISNGLSDIHSRDPNLKFSSVLDNLQSRMFMFSINIEE